MKKHVRRYSMTNRFLISAAAVALIAGTSFANAQGTGMSREAPSGGSTVQQSAPSSERGAPSAAPMNREGASDSKGADHGMKATQSDEKTPQGSKHQRAQDDMKPGAKGEKSAQDNMKGEKSKSSETTTDKGAASKDMKAEGREGQKGAADSKSQTGQTTTQSQTGQSTQSQTTGQAGAAAKLSTEQRTKITTVIRDQRVQPLNNVNFSISVGTRVPRDVRFHPLPREVVTIYPEWRGYEFVLVNNQIIVIDPRTFEIVAVLDA
jgi:hypothetical protein